MENAAHTLAGLALARLGLDRFGPAATATLVVASNLPDLDIVGALWGGRPWYLCHHRGITHAIPGIVVQGLLLGGLAWALDRRRGGARFGPLLLCAWAGLTVHLLMDGLNNYGIRPWLPFDGTWIYGDLVFIVDPWLWLTLGGAACLGSPTRGRPLGWAAFFASASAVLWTSDRAPMPVAALWTAAMGAVLVTRWRRGGATSRRRWARAGTAAALAYLAALLVLQTTARELADRHLQTHLPAGERFETRSLTARPAIPWRYGVLAQTDLRFYRFEVDVLAGTVRRYHEQDRNMDDPAIERARGTPQHRAWRVFARHPFADRWQGDLILGDGRYASQPEPSWSNLRVELDTPR